MSVDRYLQRRWYAAPGRLFVLWLLLAGPFELLYRAVVAVRRPLYRWGLAASWRAPVPVIVVGNIAVGGTGKTPVAIALCELLQRAGYRPGVVSRGYGAQPPRVPYLVCVDDEPHRCGDEPLLIARRTRCPVAIAPRRAAAVRHLLEHERCDVIICDDGLQHYALQRDIELAVVDAERATGNGHCLPCGPLREPAVRLDSVDAVILNGAAHADPPAYALELQPEAMTHLSSGEEASAVPPRTWCRQHTRVHAVAGIGNPQRFFATLRALGCEVVEHAFPDHHVFTAADLAFDDALPIVMTEKDAVKCAPFADGRHWYLPVRARLPESLAAAILAKLDTLRAV